MSDQQLFLLDFRRGRVETIDDSVPPRGVRDPEPPAPDDLLTVDAGFVLAALGTPPEPDEAA